MRTTLTIDDDVAACLERLQQSRKRSLKSLVNEALRRGVMEMEGRSTRRPPFRTKSVKLGPLLIPIDNVAEALAIAEGEAFK